MADRTFVLYLKKKRWKIDVERHNGGGLGLNHSSAV